MVLLSDLKSGFCYNNNKMSIPCLLKYKLRHYPIQIIPKRQHNKSLLRYFAKSEET
jgi:hypothetical protein